MLGNLLKKIFGSRNDRMIKQYSQVVRAINEMEQVISELSDVDLRAQTDKFKQRIQDGEELNDLLPEAFAVVRETGKRVLQMRHFDVQLIGGMVLHEGNIAEMRTGEGKTLMATLPAYLNALSGNGVHVVTVNDYLAKRDADWMGKIYQFLGLSVGVIYAQMSYGDKQAAYAADITYGTNNEYGFDYLRDNMVTHTNERVQRVLNFAIVDEVDSILIDEARTPLIISGQAEGDTEIYVRINVLIPKLIRQETEDSPGDYSVDEKSHQVTLSESGFEHAEKLLASAGLLKPGTSLYDPANINLIHHVNAGLRAHSLYFLDQHYVVQDGEVVIVDEFTGRLMAGRRWSDGLHQAVEAKEGVVIQKENQTLASITFQNYFRMYQKLSGMTGTADTEAAEFQQIYGLETVIIPTHKPMIRDDRMDLVFRTTKEKNEAIIQEIKECYKEGQPVLVGTTSIESNELLSKLLEREKLPHQVLNAKQHASEASIVAQAGRPKMVTIATNMAGRGTDIVLGGNPEPDIERIRHDEKISEEAKLKQINEVSEKWKVIHEEVLRNGGLHIIGTERHESRRVDNQLRGRSGRQGDPGSSRFFLSLEDPLLRIFASDRVANIMTRLNMPEGEAIEHPWVTKAIENAQRKVEARNFDMRKQLLEYDDVANDQRQVIYQQRNELLEAEQNISETITAIRESVLSDLFNLYIPPQSVEEQWDVTGLEKVLATDFQLHFPLKKWLEQQPDLHEESLSQRIIDLANEKYQEKVEVVGAEIIHHYERVVMLQILDSHWREHLAALDHLRQGIHLRGYAQKNPKQEYKREAFGLFTNMLEEVKSVVTKILMTVQIKNEQQVEAVTETLRSPENVQYHHDNYTEASEEDSSRSNIQAEKSQPFVRDNEKIGRNQPCPCGSGKKYKQCHGKVK
ncbi:preprotein translocase subunit SecA [Nitrosomonas ureae]|uniref:Protein translocase subunit SecA n=1 Tax=Nitrosomonas ureae TaxID=44577 RepID=A0A0S3AJ38_9PROT|nr:preprotein translocase subunit SecA [Nitrosomonas ureae]ALQ51094.1 preprotein translocase subunit SecA [Nitrosomonas ureae]PTQ85101.1 protein translocase subunit secA [Nitrosomonas ureae]PXX16135.1 protein translocase subunit secA [Nitrosomonas ureae]SDU30627.1 protein translocase subunit secA [Nitrosomonas ureae]